MVCSDWTTPIPILTLTKWVWNSIVGVSVSASINTSTQFLMRYFVPDFAGFAELHAVSCMS